MTDYRVATREDETDVWKVLEGGASEIPVPLDTPEMQAIMRGIIIECRESGKSLVATDENGKVVGFVLARPDFHERQALSLCVRIRPGPPCIAEA